MTKENCLPSSMQTVLDSPAIKAKTLRVLTSIKTASSLYEKEAALLDLADVVHPNIELDVVNAGLRILDRYVLRTNSNNVASNNTLVKLTKALTFLWSGSIHQYIEDFPALTTKYISTLVDDNNIAQCSLQLPFKYVNARRSKDIPDLKSTFALSTDQSTQVMF